MNQRITALLKAALECSVYVAPDDPGLTFEELREVGRRAGFQDGEINDAMFNAGESTFGSNRVMPGHQDRAFWHMFMMMPESPDYRNIGAFDFVFNQLNGLVKSEGVACPSSDDLRLISGLGNGGSGSSGFEAMRLAGGAASVFG